jgi:hypothetical protein
LAQDAGRMRFASSARSTNKVQLGILQTASTSVFYATLSLSIFLSRFTSLPLVLGPAWSLQTICPVLANPSPSSPPLWIVADEQPPAQIVAAERPRMAALAVLEFRHFVEIMSGAGLPMGLFNNCPVSQNSW